MRKALILLICMLSLGWFAPQANALTLTFDDSLSVGWIDPCGSRMAAGIAACIDNFISQSASGAGSGANTSRNPMGSSEPGAAEQTNVMADVHDNISELLNVYVPGGLVWRMFLSPGHEHPFSTAGNPDPAPAGGDPPDPTPDAVPDGGATVALLGLALVAIRLLKPRFV
jgi:hypothetical protein